MSNKKIYQLPSIDTVGDLNRDEILWVVGMPLDNSSPSLPVDPDTNAFTPGELFSVSIAVLKELLNPESNWKTVLSSAWRPSGTIPATQTKFNQVTGKSGVWDNTESDVQFVITEDCYIQRLFIVTDGAQPGAGSLVVTVRINGVDTALTLTIPAGGAAGTYSDIVHSISLTAGDVISYKATNNDAVSVSCTFVSAGVTLIKTT